VFVYKYKRDPNPKKAEMQLLKDAEDLVESMKALLK
jgi:transcription-repair coupling factor (superfamily II helicase)